MSPALVGGFFITEPPGKPIMETEKPVPHNTLPQNSVSNNHLTLIMGLQVSWVALPTWARNGHRVREIFSHLELAEPWFLGPDWPFSPALWPQVGHISSLGPHHLVQQWVTRM